jgi:proteic killer suppression protein
MIRSIRDRETQKIWSGEGSRRLPGEIQDAALRKLRLINAASRLEDLRVPPGNRLESLSGDRRGEYSIRINQQWRICFSWIDGEAENVEICDYH